MLLVVLFWAGNFTAAKIAFDEASIRSAFTALRFALAAVVLWFVVRWAEGPARLPRGAFWPLVGARRHRQHASTRSVSWRDWSAPPPPRVR